MVTEMEPALVAEDLGVVSVAEMEAAFQDPAKRGVVVACGQRWAERTGCMQTVYALAPGVTRENLFALAFDAYDTLDGDVLIRPAKPLSPTAASA
jgi:hypothetical protein